MSRSATTLRYFPRDEYWYGRTSEMIARSSSEQMPGAVLTQIAPAIFEFGVQREDRLALVVQRHRLDGRKQPDVDALEQRKASLCLHGLQRVADRRSRKCQFVCGRDRGPMVNDCTQDLELAQVHITTDYTPGQNIIARMIAFAACFRLMTADLHAASKSSLAY
jgi:hypothetical protein